MRYAIDTLEADTVFEMDADLSHEPEVIPTMVREIISGRADFVIGSRYVPGGSIPREWPFIRKLNSWAGNLVARLIIGLYSVHDCTGGFRAIRASVLQAAHLEDIPVAGYAFQVSLLQRAVLVGARVSEVPISFRDREVGVSKMRLKDQVEFITKSFVLRFHSLSVRYGLYALLFVIATVIAAALYVSANVLATAVVLISILLLAQGMWNLWLMIQVWDDPYTLGQTGSPKTYEQPKYSFTALLPVLHEEMVVGETIRALHAIDYPNDLKQIIVICRFDDDKTIAAAEKAIAELGAGVHAEVKIFKSIPSNKPKQLNLGLVAATGSVVVPFDAEDGPHKDLYHIVNTTMIRQNADVVQSGVQLMNFESSWYSVYNVLEYFFWFKSVLPYFAARGAVPLGGNTVFFKRKWLERVGGWDEHCLTEDAEIGMKLSQAGARIRVIYEERHATQEEAPVTLGVFIKQRTRWHQGFMQVIGKRQWRKFLTLRQQLLSLYVLAWPELQAILFLYALVSAVALFFIKLPVWVTIVSILPLYLLVVLFVVCVLALYQFCQSYEKKFPWWIGFKMLVAFYPFQILLGISAMRAVYRLIKGSTGWEKTVHVGAHRALATPEVPSK
jgi:cellulose synthase/poly-beta-1,6-N-acetylglucosamine synthase-like glycosyltransferase